jgi:hypothetical protein
MTKKIVSQKQDKKTWPSKKTKNGLPKKTIKKNKLT